MVPADSAAPGGDLRDRRGDRVQRWHHCGMPRMDDGPTDGPPGNELRTVWVVLSVDEAYELLESLKVWAEWIEEDHLDPGWHTHVLDEVGRELTIGIHLGDEHPSSRS